MSDQGTSKQNQTSSSCLYDKFLVNLDDFGEAPLTSLEAKPHCFLSPRKPSSDSTDYSTEGGESQGHSDASHPVQIQQFVDKIYKPVKGVYGFDHDAMTLKMMLLNEETPDSFKLLGVVGMLGVGKTTLCRLILDEEQVKQSYCLRVLITMPEPEPEPEPESNKQRSMEKVVETMLEHLGVEEETIRSITNKHKLPGLLYALHLQLNGKKFLIVLDDVKAKEENGNYYDDLVSCLRDGHGFPKGYGGAVILNGRNEKAIEKIVGERNLHRLELLSEPKYCWDIYQTLALNDDGVHDYPRTATASMEVQEELKKKCGGLPLAARIMGELRYQERIRKEQSKMSGEEDSKEQSKMSGEEDSKEQSKMSGEEDSKDHSSEAALVSTGSGLEDQNKKTNNLSNQ